MRFRTELIPDKYTIRFDYRKRYFFIGSCFSDNIGSIMQRGRFNVLSNPFGTVYNPCSIADQLAMLTSHYNDISFELNPVTNLVFNYGLHSSFSHHEKNYAQTLFSKTKKTSLDFIKKTDVAIITLGTAWVYRQIEQNIIVANCHKMPQRLFSKELLSHEDLNKQLQEIISILKGFNNAVEIIFTLSPVRHIKDGITENSLSKARLLTAIHNVVHHQENISYFPSYEIMIDDLRDYRFYTADLIHPNDTAIEYIWNKIMDAYFDQETRFIYQKVSKINTFLDHRPINPLDPNYLKHLEKYKRELSEMFKGL